MLRGFFENENIIFYRVSAAADRRVVHVCEVGVLGVG